MYFRTRVQIPAPPFIPSLGGAPLRSPPRCALAVAVGASPPALACLIPSLGGAPLRSPPRCALAVAVGDAPPALACLIPSLGGAPLRSPPRCALAVAVGDSPPALACLIPSLGGAPLRSPPRCASSSASRRMVSERGAQRRVEGHSSSSNNPKKMALATGNTLALKAGARRRRR